MRCRPSRRESSLRRTEEKWRLCILALSGKESSAIVLLIFEPLQGGRFCAFIFGGGGSRSSIDNREEDGSSSLKGGKQGGFGHREIKGESPIPLQLRRAREKFTLMEREKKTPSNNMRELGERGESTSSSSVNSEIMRPFLTGERCHYVLGNRGDAFLSSRNAEKVARARAERIWGSSLPRRQWRLFLSGTGGCLLSPDAPERKETSGGPGNQVRTRPRSIEE